MKNFKHTKAFGLFALLMFIVVLWFADDFSLLEPWPPELVGDTRKLESGLGSGFRRDGYWRGEPVPKQYSSLMLVGSYDNVNGFATTGEYVSGWYDGGRVSMLVSGHPRDPGLSLEIETSTGAKISFSQDNPIGRWDRWFFSVPRGEFFRIRARDESSAIHGGWLAFSEPFASSILSEAAQFLERLQPFRPPLLFFSVVLLMTMLFLPRFCETSYRVLDALGASFAIYFFLLAVYGAYILFSPVPFWDMWDGSVDFLLNFDRQNWAALLWQQHNEHRILLTRLLFLADQFLLNGNTVFLIAINYIFAILACVFFVVILKKQKADSFLVFFIISCLFFWSQADNFISAFQSQFFMAQLLPLLAFYALYEARTNGSLRLFLLSCLLGVLSAGTMANGVLALPLMLFYALLVKMNKRWLCALCVLAVLVPFMYFNGFHPNPGHGSPLAELTQRPYELLSYVFAYMGNPLYYVFGTIISAQYAGIILFIYAVYSMIRSLFNVKKYHFELCILFYLLYLGATALGTGGGRLFLGVHSAVTSRYTTPALMAIMSALVLYASKISELGRKNKILWVPFSLILFAMMPYQWRATQESDIHFDRSVSALALALGVEDETQICRIYPNMQRPLALTKEAVRQSIGVFGHGPIREIYDAFQARERVVCVKDNMLQIRTTRKTEITSKTGNNVFLVLEGRTEAPAPAEFFYVIDQEGSIIGACIVETRRGLEFKKQDRPETLRFKGYASLSRANPPFKFYEPRKNICFQVQE